MPPLPPPAGARKAVPLPYISFTQYLPGTDPGAGPSRPAPPKPAPPPPPPPPQPPSQPPPSPTKVMEVDWEDGWGYEWDGSPDEEARTLDRDGDEDMGDAQEQVSNHDSRIIPTRRPGMPKPTTSHLKEVQNASDAVQQQDEQQQQQQQQQMAPPPPPPPPRPQQHQAVSVLADAARPTHSGMFDFTNPPPVRAGPSCGYDSQNPFKNSFQNSSNQPPSLFARIQSSQTSSQDVEMDDDQATASSSVPVQAPSQPQVQYPQIPVQALSQPQVQYFPQSQVQASPHSQLQYFPQQQVQAQLKSHLQFFPQSSVQTSNVQASPHPQNQFFSQPPVQTLQSQVQVSSHPQVQAPSQPVQVPLQSNPHAWSQSQVQATPKPQVPTSSQSQVPTTPKPQAPTLSQSQVPITSKPQVPTSSLSQAPTSSHPQAPNLSQPKLSSDLQVQSQPQIQPRLLEAPRQPEIRNQTRLRSRYEDMMPPIMPNNLTQDQKEQFLIGYRLCCLDVGLQRYVMHTNSWSGSDDQVLLFHKDLKQRILAAKGTPLLMNQATNWKASPPGTKRKLSDDDQATLSNKRTNVSKPTSESAQGSQTFVFGSNANKSSTASAQGLPATGIFANIGKNSLNVTKPTAMLTQSLPATGIFANIGKDGLNMTNPTTTSSSSLQSSTSFGNIAKDGLNMNKPTTTPSSSVLQSSTLFGNVAKDGLNVNKPTATTSSSSALQSPTLFGNLAKDGLHVNKPTATSSTLSALQSPILFGNLAKDRPNTNTPTIVTGQRSKTSTIFTNLANDSSNNSKSTITSTQDSQAPSSLANTEKDSFASPFAKPQSKTQYSKWDLNRMYSTAPSPSTLQMPSFGSVSGSDFMNQFSKKAEHQQNEEEAKEKSKRKLDEVDSDDDLAEWERKYEEEQRLKRQKMTEQTSNNIKNPSFTFDPTKSTGSQLQASSSEPQTQSLSVPQVQLSSQSQLQTSSQSQYQFPSQLQASRATSFDSRESTPSLEGSIVLFEVKAKATEYDDEKKIWDTKGVGQLQVLQHQQTKKTRLVLRIPGGKIAMNMALIPLVEYKLIESRNSVTFVTTTKDGKLQTMKLKVKEDADARKLASLMEKNKSN